MDFKNFKTYGESPQNAFEAFCTQLFERYLRRKYGSDLVKFRVINGAGGDGGIEAYRELKNGDIIAVQAKWFPDTMQASQINQIKGSVETALKLRKNIREYIICVPRSFGSIKMGKGQVPVADTEESRVDQLTVKIEAAYAATTFTWWFEQDMHNELLEDDNEGMHKYYFEKDVVTHKQLVDQFELERDAWIDKRYIPELHGPGVIQSHIGQILFSQDYRKQLLGRIGETTRRMQNASSLISRFAGTLAKGNEMLPELENIGNAIDQNLAALLPLIVAVEDGVSELPAVILVSMPVSNDLFTLLGKHRPAATQLGLPERLYNLLDRIKGLELENVVSRIREEVAQSGRLFLGNPGTGKTHAVSNTADIRLNHQKVPALIIRAKGAPCDNWTDLLKKALDITSFSRVSNCSH
jgi:hypothetical protein